MTSLTRTDAVSSPNEFEFQVRYSTISLSDHLTPAHATSPILRLQILSPDKDTTSTSRSVLGPDFSPYLDSLFPKETIRLMRPAAFRPKGGLIRGILLYLPTPVVVQNTLAQEGSLSRFFLTFLGPATGLLHWWFPQSGKTNPGGEKAFKLLERTK